MMSRKAMNDIDNRPMPDAAQMDNAKISKVVRRMLGLNVDTWNDVMVAFLAIASFGAVFAGVSQFVVIKLQKAEAIQAAQDLAIYKAGVSKQVEDARNEGVEAGKAASNALLRAAELEKEAIVAKLEAEKLKQIVAWREIPKESAEALEKSLSSPGSVNLRWMDGDPEALFLAIQFSKILSKARWGVAPGAIKPANTVIFGISLPDSGMPAADLLRKAFVDAKIPFSPNQVPQEGVSFNVTTIPDAPTIIIGSRVPSTLK